MPEGDPAQAAVAASPGPVLKWNGSIVSTTPPAPKDLKNPYLRQRIVDIGTSRILAYDADGIRRTRAEAQAQSEALIAQIGENKDALSCFWQDICRFLTEAPGMGSPIDKGKAPASSEDAGPAPRALAPELSTPSPPLKRKADAEDDASATDTVKAFRVDTAQKLEEQAELLAAQDILVGKHPFVKRWFRSNTSLKKLQTKLLASAVAFHEEIEQYDAGVITTLTHLTADYIAQHKAEQEQVQALLDDASLQLHLIGFAGDCAGEALCAEFYSSKQLEALHANALDKSALERMETAKKAVRAAAKAKGSTSQTAHGQSGRGRGRALPRGTTRGGGSGGSGGGGSSSYGRSYSRESDRSHASRSRAGITSPNARPPASPATPRE